MEKEREESAEFWRKALVEGEKPLRFIRSAFRRIPSSPRCKICLAPFASIGGRGVGLVGVAPSPKKPPFFNRRFEKAPPRGAEADNRVGLVAVRGDNARPRNHKSG